jgi:hypothetical protein
MAYSRLAHEKGIESEKEVARYTNGVPQVNWWPDFVRRTLGIESAAQADIINTSPAYPNALSSG